MIYPYLCKICEAVHDQSFPMGEAPKNVECPDCGHPAIRQYTLNLVCPSDFNSWYPIDPLTKEPRTAGNRYGQSDAQKREMDQKNEAYEKSKVRKTPGPTFEQLYQQELRRF